MEHLVVTTTLSTSGPRYEVPGRHGHATGGPWWLGTDRFVQCHTKGSTDRLVIRRGKVVNGFVGYRDDGILTLLYSLPQHTVRVTRSTVFLVGITRLTQDLEAGWEVTRQCLEPK